MENIDKTKQHYSLDAKILLAMKVGERHDWPFSLSNDIRPKISYLKKKKLGRWGTKVSNDKQTLIVFRLG